MKINSCIYIIVCYSRKERPGLVHASNGPQNRYIMDVDEHRLRLALQGEDSVTRSLTGSGLLNENLEEESKDY